MRKFKFQFAAHSCEAIEWNRTSRKAVVQTLARAVRPASLAASARPRWFVAISRLRTMPALKQATRAFRPVPRVFEGHKNAMFGKARGALCEVTACSLQMQAQRGSAKPNARGRAGTSCFAARAGGVRLLAGRTTQRTVRAGCVPQWALPNPSIERTRPGKKIFYV